MIGVLFPVYNAAPSLFSQTQLIKEYGIELTHLKEKKDKSEMVRVVQ